MKLTGRVTLSISLLLTVTLFLSSAFFLVQWFDSLRFQMSNQALDLAETISRSDQIRKNILNENGDIIIQRETEKIRLNSRIQAIEVFTIDGRPLTGSYPRQERAAESESLVDEVLTRGEAALGRRHPFSTSVQAAAPVYTRGVLAGTVLVELYYGRAYQESRRNLIIFLLIILTAVLAGILVAFRLAEGIKNRIFGLEPEEIARLLSQQKLIFSSLDLGLIFGDKNGEVSLLNEAARKLVGQENRSSEANLMPQTVGAVELIRGTGGRVVMRRSRPVRDHHGIEIGTLILLEDRTEAKRRAEELTGMRQLTSALRAQNHEFLNKIHTIAGLIQLGEYQKSLEYISAVAEIRAGITDVLNRRIKDPSVAGLLLSKYNRAAEAHIEMTIDSRSNLADLGEYSDDLATILGNLIENAYEELIGSENGEIFVGIYQSAESIQGSVEDSGRGIDPRVAQNLFQRGSSTKGAGRGLGLSLVKEIIDRLGGSIQVEGSRGTAVDFEFPIESRREK